MLQLFSRFGESFLCLLGDKLLEYAINKEDGATFESLQRSIGLLRATALDVDDQIKKAESCGRKKRKRAVDNWLDQVQLIESEFRNLEIDMQREGFLKRYFSRGRAKKLDSRVRELYEISKDFVELVSDSYDFKGEKFSSSVLVGEEFEKNLESIMRLLLVDKVPSIGIYGMGGVGKTTLVQHVNNRLIEQTQEHIKVVWITVSQEFTIAMLQDKIAKALGLYLSDDNDEDIRASKLNRLLSSQRNVILIFDDVWKQVDFKKLGDPLSTNGCRLLVTSRSKKLCLQLDCKEVIKVQTLQQKEAWNLFTKALAQDNLSSEVEEAAKSQVKLCDGLPLGIIALAGSMKGEYDIHVWRDALVKLRGSIMGLEEKVFDILKYSFDRLDRIEGTNSCYSEAQQCFLCCSLFPEDHHIPRDDLIEMFILEDILERRDSRKASFDQGHTILDQLVNVSLLERVNRDCVKMHDLVRAMALKITQGTNKVIAGNHSLREIPNDGEWTKELEKMCLMMNDICTIPDGMSVECPKLSTLILSLNRNLEFIPKSFFLHMCNLSILDLSSTKIKRLPDEVSNMENLKALILGGCRSLVYVPSLGKLEKLRKLDVSNTGIEELPQGMEKLINLQFLALIGIYKLNMLLCNFVLNFRYLQFLFLPVHVHVKVEELVELKYLEEFHGRVKDLNEFIQLIRSRQNMNYRIVVQQLHDNDDHDSYFYVEQGYNALHLKGCDVKELKDEDVNVLEVGIIRSLLIKKCEGWSSNSLVEGIRQLINPTFLKHLEIIKCEGIETILSKKQCGGATSTSPLIVFTSLTHLRIVNCKNIKSLGISVTQLPNLKLLYIRHCSEMKEIFEVEKGKEQSGSEHMQTASYLCIYLLGLPKLKSISNATIVCASLEHIQIWGCESLNKFPVVFGQPNYDSPPLSLQRIWLLRSEEEWWKKMELGHPTHHTLLQSYVYWLEE